MKLKQKGAKQSAKSTTATSKAFTEEERGAIKDRVQEMKAGKGEGESVVLAKISEMRASPGATVWAAGTRQGT